MPIRPPQTHLGLMELVQKTQQLNLTILNSLETTLQSLVYENVTSAHKWLADVTRNLKHTKCISALHPYVSQPIDFTGTIQIMLICWGLNKTTSIFKISYICQLRINSDFIGWKQSSVTSTSRPEPVTSPWPWPRPPPPCPPWGPADMSSVSRWQGPAHHSIYWGWWDTAGRRYTTMPPDPLHHSHNPGWRDDKW